MSAEAQSLLCRTFLSEIHFWFRINYHCKVYNLFLFIDLFCSNLKGLSWSFRVFTILIILISGKKIYTRIRIFLVKSLFCESRLKNDSRRGIITWQVDDIVDFFCQDNTLLVSIWNKPRKLPHGGHWWKLFKMELLPSKTRK